MEEQLEKFEETLFEEIANIATEEGELLLNNIIGNEVIQNIPIANIVVALGKTVQGLYNINLFYQTKNFIETFRNNTISKEKLEKYKNRLKDNKRKLQKELGRILIILNEIKDEEKSKLLAKFYLACINEEITWERFCEFADVIETIFVSDLETLYEIYKDTQKQEVSITIYEKYRTDRLISTGLLSLYSKGINIREITGDDSKRETFEKNDFGELFVKIATK